MPLVLSEPKLVSYHVGLVVPASAMKTASYPGGSLNEMLTVYTIVEALTANLPAVSAVQILVDGHEVDTLAGHVDLRQPLRPAAQWVERPQPDQPGEPAAPELPPSPLPGRPIEPARVGQ